MKFRVLILAIIGLLQFNTEGGVVSTFAQTGQWVNIVENSDLEGDDVSCFFTRENLDEDIELVPSTIVDGAGVDDSRGIVVHSVDNPSETWNTQFFVRLTQSLPAGTKYRFSFDYKASQETNASMQSHEEPSVYIHWDFGSTIFTTSWQHYKTDGIITEEMSKDEVQMRTVAFNLAEIATATTYYFDNIVFEIYEGEEDPMSWANIVKNSDLEGSDVSCFYVSEDLDGGKPTELATIVDGAGVDDSRGIVVQSVDDPTESWNTQFYVRLPQSLPWGTKYRFSFDHKASQEANVTMQCHDEPGDFIYYGFGGDVSVTTSWQHYEREGYISGEMSKADKQMRTIALDLAHNTTATTFYFDNIVFEIYQSQEEDESVTISADDKTMVYGDDVPKLTFSSSGAALSGTPKLTTTATKTSPVGTYPIKVERGTVTNEQVTFVYGTMSVTKAALSVGVQDVAIIEGDPIPTFTLSYSGFRNDDTESNAFSTLPVASTTATSSSKAGTYPITVKGGVAKNYALTYTAGTLTILEKGSSDLVTITADDKTMVYGDDVPALTFSSSGAALQGTPKLSTTATKNSPVGTYPIKVEKGTVANEQVTYVYGTLTITKAPLTAKADDKTMQQGDEVPPLTVSYSGWKLGETESVLTKKPTASTTANSQTKPGTYRISISGGEAQNYDFIYERGTLTILPPSTVDLSISSTGNGYVAYDGNTVRAKTSSFSVDKGTNAILKFIADAGNRLKSVKVNGQDVTSTIVNNQYTVSNISENTSVQVAFEPIPNYSLNIVASGNGSVSYDGTTIRNQSHSFTLEEGTTAVVSLTPDTGYRIKSVKVNNTDKTSQASNGKITINDIDRDTNLEVTFEEIPPTTYTLRISVSDNGSVIYDGNTIRGTANTFNVVEGSYATIQIAPDEGYKLKSVTLNGTDVTADVANDQYTTEKIMSYTRLNVEFEAVPTHTLTIKSSAFGSVKYGDAVITNRTETFTVKEGESAVLTFVADDNGRLLRILLNDNLITQELTNGQYTISDIKADQSVDAEYEEDVTKLIDAGVAYTVTSYDDRTVILASGNYGQVLTVPSRITAKGKTWRVVGMADDALKGSQDLAAIVWKPEVPFTGEVSNPNLLLYVKAGEYAPADIPNVIIGNMDKDESLVADNIVLTEAENGNNFYCPIAFTAKHISYEHNYSMISGYKTCQGWETLVLPFDVDMIINAKGTELVPYGAWQQGGSRRPFWLYQLTESGWQSEKSIQANVPYILSIPNNEIYQSSYNVAGNIEFMGNNVVVKASDNMTTGRHGNKRFVANYQNKVANKAIYALNVSNLWCQNTDTEREGSAFIRNLRAVHPFEAYMTLEGGSAPWMIPVFDNGVPTNIVEIESMRNVGNEEWYDLQGRKLQGEPTQHGIYIYKGRKVKK